MEYLSGQLLAHVNECFDSLDVHAILILLRVSININLLAQLFNANQAIFLVSRIIKTRAFNNT